MGHLQGAAALSLRPAPATQLIAIAGDLQGLAQQDLPQLELEPQEPAYDATVAEAAEEDAE